MEEVDLKEVFLMFWTRKIQIIAIVLIFAMVGVIFTITCVTPKYKASTTLILAMTEKSTSASETTEASITQTEVTLNQKLVSTYSELIKSKSVLRTVINNLKIDISEAELEKNIAISVVKNSELIQLDVINENSEYAAKIANEIAKVFTDMILQIYNINNVHVVDKAEATDVPYNINHIKDIAIFSALGVVVAVIYALIDNMIDNTIKTTEDIEKCTNLIVLASIPYYDEDAKKGGSKK